jgi:hypothetical protein
MAKAPFKPVLTPPGLKDNGFRLGDEVVDTINGIKGVAVARTYHITGCDTYGVELPIVDNKEPERYFTSATRLALDVAHPERHIDEVPDGRICFGDTVKDHTSGMIGTVTHFSVPLSSAIQINIQPPYDNKAGKMPDSFFVDEHMVEVTTPYTPREPLPEEKRKRTDGPADERRSPDLPACLRPLGRGCIHRIVQRRRGRGKPALRVHAGLGRPPRHLPVRARRGRPPRPDEGDSGMGPADRQPRDQ